MIINGLSITVIGMAIVFGFLIILVLTIMLTKLILTKFFPKSLESKPGEGRTGAQPAGPQAATRNGKDDLAAVAAAVAAIQAHIAVSRG